MATHYRGKRRCSILHYTVIISIRLLTFSFREDRESHVINCSGGIKYFTLIIADIKITD